LGSENYKSAGFNRFPEKEAERPNNELFKEEEFYVSEGPL
jgi:hypothetical protein